VPPVPRSPRRPPCSSHLLENEWLLILAGLASVVFGILVFLFPGAGAPLALVWLISAYAIVSSILLLGLSVRARGWRHHHTLAPAPA
jgi:uncharacterized membrane protein HdeD (DUF308 family)